MAHREFGHEMLALDVAVVLGLDVAAVVFLDVAARAGPGLAQARQALVDVDLPFGLGIGARGVVDDDRRLAPARLECDLAHGHAQGGLARAGEIHFARRL